MTKEELIAKFNSLSLKGLPEVTQLYELKGDFINLVYTLPGGSRVKLWDDDKVYWGAELCREGSDLCYGLAAGDGYLLVCEYGEGGSDAEIILFQKL